MSFADHHIFLQKWFKRIFFSLVFVGSLWQPGVFAQNDGSETKAKENLIHIGDTVDVDFVGSVEYDWRGNLTPEGFLDGLDYAEKPVFALCRDETEVARDIVAAYSKLLRDPQVVVRIVDRSKRPPATIYGAVKTEQRFQLLRPAHLNELIVLAGGLTDRVSGDIEILRQPGLNCLAETPTVASLGNGVQRDRMIQVNDSRETTKISIKISDLLTGKVNPLILSGDTVTVSEAAPVYVIGGVVTPQKIALRNSLTLSRAIAAAGGLTKDADTSVVTIFRRDGAETKIISADYSKTATNASEDLILQALDVVEVAVKGRGKSKYPPVVKNSEIEKKIEGQLPLRIID